MNPTGRPAIPAPPHRGGCLCGTTRYSLDARPLGVNACHCVDCKKLSSGTHSRMVLARSSDFRQLSGEVVRYRKTADSGRQIDIVRCGQCATRLWHEPLTAPEYVFITAGTLDDSDWAVPTSHIWIDRANTDDSFHGDALLVGAQPETRQMLFDAFDRIYPKDA